MQTTFRLQMKKIKQDSKHQLYMKPHDKRQKPRKYKKCLNFSSFFLISCVFGKFLAKNLGVKNVKIQENYWNLRDP